MPAAGGCGGLRMRGVLRQIVGDGEPRRLGADEDVLARADGRIVDQGAHGDVNEGAVAHDRIEQRAARLAVRVVAVFVAKDHEVVLAAGDAQLVALDAGERLERRAGRAPAVRAMAVRGVDEFVRHRVVHGAALALAGERTDAGFLRAGHRLSISANVGAASVPIPKFASFCGTLVCELRNRRTLATY